MRILCISFEWNEYLAPSALYELQNAGIRTRVAMGKFSFRNNELDHTFTHGTIMIHTEDQPVNKAELRKIIESAALKCRLTVYGVSTAFTETGMDLGSGNFRVLEKPSVAMIIGDGISSSDAGEIWHMFDTRFGIPLTMFPVSRLNNISLNRYNVLIIAGSPETDPQVTEKIKLWNRQGGTIIAYKNGNNWLKKE